MIELFTARTHRRRGLARLLLSTCSAVTVALRVDPANLQAMHLYQSFGFHEG